MAAIFAEVLGVAERVLDSVALTGENGPFGVIHTRVLLDFDGRFAV